ncbi:MAG: S46 family peptidase [Bacteroidales bacterium]|jgi:hypothetical protein|nr:S46 family peptidase [Bacteroidales bacterium]
MLKKSFTLSLIAILLTPFISFADEGMWLPLLLGKQEADMQKNGMKISAKDIYDVNNASLKDAVMLFAGGCTGEFVSNEGLLLTNHHCGYGYIVRHSSVERDYLTNGFWALNKQEELPCDGLSITLLVYMEDVTGKVLKGVTNSMTEKERNEIIEKNSKEVISEATKDNHYKAEIAPFYYGNQYFLYVNEVFTDVRLVGAPPSNIGKFGGDTDNWMWPRHTGDFSMFRVYASKDNKPAKYSKDNIPFAPKKFLKINLSGAKEGDFTFVFGYPGSTTQFLTSFAVDDVQNFDDPTRIKLREKRLDIYNKAIKQGPAQRLRYANTIASIANGWKKWIGEVRGLKRLNTIEKKKDFENNFNSWCQVIEERKENYGGLISSFEKEYSLRKKLNMDVLYLREAVLASDLMKNARNIYGLLDRIEKGKISDKEEIDLFSEKLLSRMQNYFSNDYTNHKEVDKAIFVDLMTTFYNDYSKENIQSSVFGNSEEIGKNPEKYFEKVYETSFLSNEKKTNKYLKKFNVKKIKKDPAIELFALLWENIEIKQLPALGQIEENLDSLYRIYVRGIMEKESSKQFYPDANLTLRVAYGKIEPYYPKDAVKYLTHTTIEGIMEKENPEIYDYVVEKKLKDLYKRKDYGRYKNEKGELPIAFIASNHTTSGNSGSPVLDANGNLIGINFDRNWEGTMSDIDYDKSQCRNISLDIRYCLFIIDKFAGASNLINEMTILE